MLSVAARRPVFEARSVLLSARIIGSGALDFVCLEPSLGADLRWCVETGSKLGSLY